MTFGLLMLPLLVAVPVGPMLAWKRGDLLGALQRVYVFAGLSLAAGLIYWYVHNGGPVMAIFALALGFWGMLGAVADLWNRAQFGKLKTSVAFRRLIGLPRSAFGTAIAHFGLGVTVLGIFSASVYGTEAVVDLKPGATVSTGGYELTFQGMKDGAARTIPNSAASSRSAVAAVSSVTSRRRSGSSPPAVRQPPKAASAPMA